MDWTLSEGNSASGATFTGDDKSLMEGADGTSGEAEDHGEWRRGRGGRGVVERGQAKEEEPMMCRGGNRAMETARTRRGGSEGMGTVPTGRQCRRRRRTKRSTEAMEGR